MNETLKEIFNMGYCVEIFKENNKYLVFIWPDVSHGERLNRNLVCSRYGKTVNKALKNALEYLKNNQIKE